jgi:hypothetical protein
MNWYKMAQFNNWEQITAWLRKELGREPTVDEIQKVMLLENFNDSYKEPQRREEVFAQSKWKDKIPGGNADGDKPSDYEKSQVERGQNIEFEHSDDPDIAKEIAMDHLEEHADYYVGLEHMENCLKEIEERAKKKK